MKRKKESLKQFLDRCWAKPSEEDLKEAEKEVWSRIKAELSNQDTSLWSLYGDGWNAPALEQREFQVLTAVQMAAGGGDLSGITRNVFDWDGSISWGGVAAILTVLERRKLVTRVEDRWQLTEDGDRALRRAKEEKRQLVEVRADVKQALPEESK